MPTYDKLIFANAVFCPPRSHGISFFFADGDRCRGGSGFATRLDVEEPGSSSSLREIVCMPC